MSAAMKAELRAIYQTQKIDLVREDLPDLVEDCLDGTERMKKIVLGLKGFARKDASEQRLSDINQCIEEALTIAWNELKYKAEVNRNFSPLPQTMCCPQQLAQVFIILLVNAAHAITEKGLIDIRSHFSEENIYVEIQDTGCGIPPENLSKIFEPFFTTKARDKGTGLGMGIARDIVTRHKGNISVESTPGQGTCFTLSFPVLQNLTIES
jgi:signal transduction histidine kinase